MSFLAPYVLFGTLAAGIPVAIHFFFRSRFRTIPWAAMEFLLQSVEQTSRRIRFQELLLLIIRSLLLLLLAFALARPTTRAVTGAGGDAVDCVLLIDDSLSMDAKDHGPTRFERVKAAAKAVIDHLPPHSTAQILTCSDRATLVGPRRPSDLDQAHTLIDGLAVSARGSDLATGFRAAVDVMKKGTSPQRELYVFTDGQARAFEQQSTALMEAARAAREQGTVYLARTGGELERNATLLGIAPQTGIPHTGERVGFAVLIKNTGNDALRDLTVSLATDGNEKSREVQPLPKLDAGETRAVTLTGRWTEPGLRTITARVQSDDLATDDRFDQVLRVRDKVRVLVIDGAPSAGQPEKSSSYFLLHALMPVKDADRSKYYMQPRLITPAQASPGHLTDQDICIMSNVAVERDPAKPGQVLPEDFIEALHRFVRDGKTLLIFAGDRTKPDAYNRALLDRLELLPLRLTAVRDRPERSEVGFDRSQLADPTFMKFRDDETYQTFGLVKTTKSIDGEPIPGDDDRLPTRVLLRYTDGRPAVALHSAGAGTVAMVTTSADVSWTDMPLWVNIYIPLLDSLLAHLLLAETDAHNVSAGTGIKAFVTAADGERPFVLVRPDGERLRIGQPAPVQGRPRVSAPDTPLAGLYRLMPADAADAAASPFAVTCDRAEAEEPALMTNERIAERLGFAPVHLTITDDLTPFAGGERAKREWTPKLLWVLLALALFEAGFAWFVGRPK